MSEIDDRVRKAFDALSAPEDLVARTLAAVEVERAASASASSASTHGGARGGRGGTARPEAVRAMGRHRRMRMLLAASLAAVLFCGGASVVYASESAYVEVSGESSLEIAVNRLGIVVRCTVHELGDGTFFEESSVVGKPYEEAVSMLIDGGFVGDGEGESVEFFVTCPNEGQCARIEGETARCLDASGIESAECSRVSEEERAEAFEAGMGVARYRAFEALKELDPSVTEQECADMTMRELRDAIEEAGGTADALPEGAQSHGQGQGGSNGEGIGQGQAQGEGQTQAQGRQAQQGQGGQSGTAHSGGGQGQRGQGSSEKA